MMAANSSNDEPACDRNLPTGNGSPKNMQIQTKNGKSEIALRQILWTFCGGIRA